MARPLLKIQRYFRRKPVRFFSFILLYLTAGSLVFLHSGFSGDGRVARQAAPPDGGGALPGEGRGLGLIGRVFKDTRQAARRFGPPWMKTRSPSAPIWSGGEERSSKSRGARGRSGKEMEDGRVRRCLPLVVFGGKSIVAVAGLISLALC